MSTFIDRIEKLMDGMSGAEFARKIGMKPQTLHNYLKGREAPLSLAINICEGFGVSGTWLLTGKGEMYGVDQGKASEDFNKDLMRAVIEAVEEGSEELKLRLKPDKKADLVIALYEIFQEEKQVDRKTILRLIKLAA